MRITRERLESKGWSDEEINKTLAVLEHAKRNPHIQVYFLNNAVYWIALMLIIFGNFAFSILLLPLIITIHNLTLFFLILLVSFSFGIMMSIIIKDMEDLETKHHLAMFLLVPVIALANFFVIVNVANKNIVAEILHAQNNPWVVGLIYLVGFMLPYIYFVFEEKWKF